MKLSEFRKKFGEGTDFDLDYGNWTRGTFA